MSAISTHLSAALQAAVPLWMADLLRLHGGPTPLDLRKARVVVAPLLATQGDALLYRRGHRGDTAEVFNALAYGLAILAFEPGGITVFGCHFEAQATRPPPQEAPP